MSREIEVLVPRNFVWWTFLALAAEPSNRFGEARFVDQLSSKPDVIVIHSCLLEGIKDNIHSATRVIILLWDGLQSQMEATTAIDAVCKRTQQVEYLVVGDLLSGEAEDVNPLEWRYLFTQTFDRYDKGIVFSKKTRGMSFSGLFGRWTLEHRTKLITLKVAFQLLKSRRFSEYRMTKFVYCGQSGLVTLRRYSKDYGVDIKDCIYDRGGIQCDRQFLLRWMAAIAKEKKGWVDFIVMRALFRLVALRRLWESMPNAIFLNIYPETNINAYQASMLFRNHIFLDFGGINGDEQVYPRSADMIYNKRKVIKFDSTIAMRKLQALRGDERAMLSDLLSWYEEKVLSTIEVVPKTF